MKLLSCRGANAGRCRRDSASRRLRLCALAGLLSACSRGDYRRDADEEVKRLVAEKSQDPRWGIDDFTIDLDPRSRYFDPTDPDFPPMPTDDPASHELMVRVDGKDGYAGWDESGTVGELENPDWRAALVEDLEASPGGEIEIGLEDAVRLALLHAPDYQEQLETIYLSALDVSTERFRFDVQFFGGADAVARHQGSDNPGGESTTVAVEPFGSARKGFATAGELIVGFVNSLGWEFFGPNDGFAATQLSFSFVQPLLRGGGRAVALEQLTIAERTLLANLRAFEYYRQGFYTDVVIGNAGVSGPQRRGGFFGGTGLTGFTGQGSGGFGGVGDVTGFGRGGFGGGGAGGADGGAGFAGGGAGTVGGFIGLLQQTQQIRNTRESLNAQLRTLALLEANLDAGLIDIAQVDQFRQNIETERANLLQAQNGLTSSLDAFNRSTLGLPPDLPLVPDESLIRPFQLIAPAVSAAQEAITRFIGRFGELPEDPSLEALEEALGEIEPLRQLVAEQLELIPDDLRRLSEGAGERTESMTPAERRLFERDLTRLAEDLVALRERLAATGAEARRLREEARDENRAETADGIVELLGDLELIVGELSLIQARSRLEVITVEPISLPARDALEIARTLRLDWMNNRSALVDTWRLIEFNANALKSNLTLRFSGDLRSTGDDNPVKFRDDTGSLRGSLEFDGPFTRLVERNSFRQQLIQYQQDRRRLIGFEDTVHQTLRQILRDLEQLRVNLEIQRRAVAIAIRRVDQTREALNRPVPPTVPGQAPQALGPTAAQNLLFALSDLRNTQNNLMSVWLNHYAARMRLYRELGVMRLDDDGLWIDEPLDEVLGAIARAEPLPPEVPGEWLALGEAPDPAATGRPPPGYDGERYPSSTNSEARHGGRESD